MLCVKQDLGNLELLKQFNFYLYFFVTIIGYNNLQRLKSSFSNKKWDVNCPNFCLLLNEYKKVLKSSSIACILLCSSFFNKYTNKK